MAQERATYTLNQVGKAVFDQQYDQADPRDYFVSLNKVSYSLPGLAKPVFRATIDALRQARGLTNVKVLDLACSYGVNAALLKTSLSMDDLYAHYDNPEVAKLSREELLEQDRAFYRDRQVDEGLTVIGQDSAAESIRYSVAAGLLDAGIADNMEEGELGEASAELVAGTDLVMSTGAISYVSKTTFARVLDVTGENRPWMAHFASRATSFEPIAALLSEWGYVTEQLPGTFRQRQFATEQERERAIANVKSQGRDPEGIETEGWYHAEFFLSRPADETRALPVSRIATAPKS